MAYTPTVYTNDASSPDLDATNLNKSEQGIKLAHDIAVPVDNTSRVAEYTGDGIPLIPDNVAGTTFVRDGNWTDLGGWTVGQATTSYVNGKLRLTATGPYPQIAQSNYSAYSGKEIVYKVKKISGSATEFIIKSGSSTIKKASITTGTTIFDTTVLPTLSTTFVLLFAQATVGDVYEIETVYIGTGAYDTPALDRAGNGNSLSLNAVTPVNGKYGKEMSFNGSTSYAQASSQVIGTTGTVAVRFKINSTVTTEIIADTRIEPGVYGVLIFVVSNSLKFRCCSDTYQEVILTNACGIGWRSLEISYDSTNIYSYLDGVLISTTQISVSGFTNNGNLLLGKNYASNAFFNGTISHFRYDSRIWTADEARVWSLNPISIDSRV